MQSFLLKKKDKETFLDTIKSLKYSTWENYRASINRFGQFCKEQYSGRNIEDVVFELKSIPEESRDEAYFDVLQDFVNWLSDKKLSGSTINMYYQVITYFFSFNGIRIHPIDLQRHIRRPKQVKEKPHPLSRAEILDLFEHTPDHRKMLYLVLIGSGMRIQECVA